MEKAKSPEIKGRRELILISQELKRESANVLLRYQISPSSGLVFRVFAMGLKVRGLKPGRGRSIIKGDKNP
jgi:hypothetical protein